MTEVQIFKKIGFNKQTYHVRFVCPDCKGIVNFVHKGVYWPKTCPFCDGVLPRIDYLMYRLRRRVCWHVAYKLGMRDSVLAEADMAGKEGDPFDDTRGYD